mgnify:CR=1 FL=1
MRAKELKLVVTVAEAAQKRAQVPKPVDIATARVR